MLYTGTKVVKLYLIFQIGSQWLYQSLDFIISFYKKMKNKENA